MARRRTQQAAYGRKVTKECTGRGDDDDGKQTTWNGKSTFEIVTSRLYSIMPIIRLTKYREKAIELVRVNERAAKGAVGVTSTTRSP
jgi:hypothetical protein